MRKSISIIVGGAALAMIATGALGTQAQAAPATGAAPAASTYYSCPAYAACLWKDTSLKTAGSQANFYAFTTFDRSFSGNTYRNTGYSVQDSASSMVNNGVGGADAYVTLFKDHNCSGTSFTKPPHSYDMDFTNGTPAGSFDNSLTSGAFDGSYLTQCQNP